MFRLRSQYRFLLEGYLRLWAPFKVCCVKVIYSPFEDEPKCNNCYCTVTPPSNNINLRGLCVPPRMQSLRSAMVKPPIYHLVDL